MANMAGAVRCCVTALLVGCGGTVATTSDGGADSTSEVADAPGCRPTPVGRAVCSNNDDCPGDEFCISVGACGCPGVCTSRRLSLCSAEPVCGCDGKTYEGGLCEAAAAGVTTRDCP